MSNYQTAKAYMARKPDIVAKMSLTVSTDDCWLFAGAKTANGYGIIRFDGKYCRAHKVMYEAIVGEVPAGLILDHLCETGICINPEHLEPVTNQENTQRHYDRRNGDKCRNGHLRSDYSIMHTEYRHSIPSRAWVCLLCRSISRSRRYWERQTLRDTGGADG